MPPLPPRAGRPGGPRGERRAFPRRPSGSIWYGVALLLILAVTQMYFLVPSGRQVPYSEFKSQLKDGKVAEVTVGDETIHGTLKPSGSNQKAEAFSTSRIEDPQLVAELEQARVKYTGEPTSRWFSTVLGSLIPLLLLFGLWSLVFRRMGSAEGGVMCSYWLLRGVVRTSIEEPRPRHQTCT